MDANISKKYFISAFTTLLLVGCGGNGNTTSAEASAGNNGQGSGNNIDLSIMVSAQPDSVTNKAYAQFEFSAQDAVSYQCQLNSGEYQDCSSPHVIMPLETGDYQLAIRALDSQGGFGEESIVNWSVASIFSDQNLDTVHEDLIRTSVQPDPVSDNSWRGIFRINCDFAHASYNDPIVFPGEENAAHLHRFYGNMLTDHTSTNESLFTSGESTCQGNLLNRSSYWVPSLLAPKYDQITGERELDSNGDPAWQMVPAVVGNDDEAHEIFYYSAGVDDLESIQPIPVGLRIIAGDHMGQPGMEQDTSIVRWHCQTWESDDSSNPQFSSSIPECYAPDRLRMDIFFPSCWNGVDLDSADHKSHMAYPVNNGGPNGTVCPDTHPIALVRPSFHYAFGVKPEVYDPQTLSSMGWKLASDMYTANDDNPGGMSLHGDWVNAWHPEAMQALLDNCIKQELDCHDGNLANGFRLSGTQPGSQEEPEVINGGAGY